VDDMIPEDSNLRTVELTPRERLLLLKYGYPFPEQEETATTGERPHTTFQDANANAKYTWK